MDRTPVRAPDGPGDRGDHYSGTAPFERDSDRWDLSSRETVALSPGGSTLTFDALPAPWKDDVKAYIVHGLLVDRLSNGWARSTMTVLRRLARLCEDRHAGQHPTQLDEADARIMERDARNSQRVKARSELRQVARFAEFLRERHAGQPASFRPNPHGLPRPRWRKTYSEGWERVIPDEVSAALLRAVQERLHGASEIGRGRRSEELYLVVVILLLFSGRRISELLLLPRDCLRRPTDREVAETGPGIWLLYRNTKTGSQTAETFIPEPGAACVEEAVQRAHRITAPLAETIGMDRLFLTNARAGALHPGIVRTVSAKAFTAWLNGRMTEDGEIQRPGFIHWAQIRYQGAYYPIDPHQARHTLAHKAYLGGASYAQVSDHLGHRYSRAGLNPMTGVYIHGEEGVVRRILDRAERGLLMGRAAPLVENRATVVAMEPKDAAVFRAQGLIVQPTHYGHCCLPEAQGPCVSSDPCWIGPQGRGCDYALYTPDSQSALQKDRDLLVQQVAELEQEHPDHPRLGQWRTRLTLIDRLLQEIAAGIDRQQQGLPMRSPRAGIEPQEPDLRGQQVLPPAPGRRLKWRRRDAALRSGVRPPQCAGGPKQTPEEPDHAWHTAATKLVNELESAAHPIEPASVSRRLSIPLRLLLQDAGLMARIQAHNEPFPRALKERMTNHLEVLEQQGQPLSYEEFAQLHGIAVSTLFHQYGQWSARLTAHNRALALRHERQVAEDRLTDLEQTHTTEPIRQFANAVHHDPGWLRRNWPDLTDRLAVHNRALGLRGTHVRHSEAERVLRQD